MFEQWIVRERLNEKRLNLAFAPLNAYLEKEYPEQKSEIISCMMFMGDHNNQSYYKNKITRSYIVLNPNGDVVSCEENALQYQFEWSRDESKIIPFEERFIHQNVTRWVQQHLKKKQLNIFNEAVSLFLQDVWGPLVNFDFFDLQVGYPLRHLLNPKTLYLTSPDFLHEIAFQFISDKIAQRACSLKEYLRFEQMERELMNSGWRVLSFCLDGVPESEKDPLHKFLSKELFYMDEHTEFVLNKSWD